MAQRNPTLYIVGDQWRSPSIGRRVEEFSEKAGATRFEDADPGIGGARRSSQWPGTHSPEQPPTHHSQFGKRPPWAALPLDVIACLGALIATAVLLLLVLSQWPMLP
jgi:hypothetical protein